MSHSDPLDCDAAATSSAAGGETERADGKSGGGSSGKLEALSREDLIKFVKKQTVLFSKTKARVEALSEDNKTLEKKVAALSAVEERTREVEEEREAAVVAYNAVQEAQSQALLKIKELQDQLGAVTALNSGQNRSATGAMQQREQAVQDEIDCLKMKDRTLTETLHSLQADQDRLLKEKQELIQTVETSHRDLEFAINERDQLREQCDVAQTLQAQLQAANAELESCREVLSTVHSLETRLQAADGELRAAQIAMPELTLQLQTATADLDRLRAENAVVMKLETQLAAAMQEVASSQSKLGVVTELEEQRNTAVLELEQLRGMRFVLAETAARLEAAEDELQILRKQQATVPDLLARLDREGRELNKLRERQDVVPSLEARLQAAAVELDCLRELKLSVPELQANLQMAKGELEQYRDQQAAACDIAMRLQETASELDRLKEQQNAVPELQERLQITISELRQLREHQVVVPELQERLQTATEELKRLKDQHAQLMGVEERLCVVTSELNHLRAQQSTVSDLEASLQAANAELDVLKAQQAQQAQSARLQERLDQLVDQQGARSDLESRLQATTSELAEIRRKPEVAVVLQEKLQMATTELERLQMQQLHMSDREARLHTAMIELDLLRSRERDHDAVQLKAGLEIASTEIDYLKGELQQNQTLVSELEIRLLTAGNELDRLGRDQGMLPEIEARLQSALGEVAQLQQKLAAVSDCDMSKQILESSEASRTNVPGIEQAGASLPAAVELASHLVHLAIGAGGLPELKVEQGDADDQGSEVSGKLQALAAECTLVSLGERDVEAVCLTTYETEDLKTIRYNLEEQLLSSAAAISTLQTQLTAARTDAAGDRVRLRQAEENIASHMAVREALMAQLTNAQAELNHCLEARDELCTQLEQVQADLKARTKNWEELAVQARSQLTDSEQHASVVDNLTLQLQQTREDLAKREEACNRLEQVLTEHEALQRAREQAMVELREASGRQAEHCEQLQRAIEAGELREQQLATQVQQAQEVGQMQAEQCELLTHELQQAEEHTSEQAEQCEALATRLQQAHSDCAGETAMCEQLRLQLQQAVEAASMHSEQCEQLTLQLQRLQQDGEGHLLTTSMNSSVHGSVHSGREPLRDTDVEAAPPSASQQLSLPLDLPAGDERKDNKPLDWRDSQLLESEAKCSKFKAIALKAKKEAGEFKKACDKLATDVRNLGAENSILSERLRDDAAARGELTATLQGLQRNYESVHDALDGEQTRRLELDAVLARSARELCEARELLADTCATKDLLTKQLDVASRRAQSAEQHSLDMAAKHAAAEKERDALQRSLLDLQRDKELLAIKGRDSEELARKEETRLRSELTTANDRLLEARSELDQLQKTMSKSSLMDLEIADYEKTVETYQERIHDKDCVIDALQKDVEHAKRRAQSLESQLEMAEAQRKHAEERGDKLRHLCAKVKKELADIKDSELQYKSAEAVLRGHLEAAKQLQDACKVETTELLSQKSLVEERLRAAIDVQQRLAVAHEVKVHGLQADLAAAQARAASLQADFDGYKVRVHSVLKQQKTKSTMETALEVEKEARARIELALEQLKAKLVDASNRLQTVTSELEALQDEHERLLARHAHCSQELRDKEANWRQRLEAANADAATMAALNDAAEQHQRAAQSDLVRHALEGQRRILLEEHDRAIVARDNALAEAENERRRLQRELRELQQHHQQPPPAQATVVAARVEQTRHNIMRLPSTQAEESMSEWPSDVGTEQPLTPLSLQTREEGEGMEQPAPSQQRHLQLSGMSPVTRPVPLVPFDQLLLAGEDAVSVRSVGSLTGEESFFKPKLLSLEKQAEHLRELLNEAEMSNNHLREQARVLKNEIRRLERNQERDNSISNMEYLKNVVLKFLILKDSDEKAQLVPVLATMLRLSEEECHKVEQVARGDETAGAPSSAAAQKGWGSYIPRWTGLS